MPVNKKMSLQENSLLTWDGSRRSEYHKERPQSHTIDKPTILREETLTARPRGYKYGVLGECLLISSLPGKALRTLVNTAMLAERFNMRSESRAW